MSSQDCLACLLCRCGPQGGQLASATALPRQPHAPGRPVGTCTVFAHPPRSAAQQRSRSASAVTRSSATAIGLRQPHPCSVAPHSMNQQAAATIWFQAELPGAPPEVHQRQTPPTRHRCLSQGQLVAQPQPPSLLLKHRRHRCPQTLSTIAVQRQVSNIPAPRPLAATFTA